MLRLGSSGLRAIRATLLGGAVGALTLTAHMGAHGHTSAWAILAIMLLAVAAADLLSLRRLRLWVLLAYAAGFQLAGHWLLTRMGTSTHATAHAAHAPDSQTARSVSATEAGSTSISGNGPLAARADIGDVAVATSSGSTPRYAQIAEFSNPDLESSLASTVGSSWVMTSAHLAAAVVIAVLVWRHDAAWFAFSRALERTAAVVFGRFELWPPRPRAQVVAVTVVTSSIGCDLKSRLLLWGADRRRGPPLTA